MLRYTYDTFTCVSRICVYVYTRVRITPVLCGFAKVAETIKFCYLRHVTTVLFPPKIAGERTWKPEAQVMF